MQDKIKLELGRNEVQTLINIINSVQITGIDNMKGVLILVSKLVDSLSATSTEEEDVV